MKVVIVEDEMLAARQLTQFIQRYDDSIIIDATIDSIEDAVSMLPERDDIDLVFMDIHLSDGLCFEIFARCELRIPVIFTTAYDQYAIKAFKVNSLDYLLKPIKYDELCAAIDKLKSLRTPQTVLTNTAISNLHDTLLNLTRNYKNRFLIKAGEHIRFKNVEEIAYLFADGKITYLVDEDNRKFIIDYTLEELETKLDPLLFYRANRKVIAKISSIVKIVTHQNSRLKIFLKPDFGQEIVVSREKTPQFLKWLDR